MEKEKLEKKLMKSLKKAWKLYKDFEPEGDYLSLAVVECPDCTFFMINNGTNAGKRVNFSKQKKNA